MARGGSNPSLGNKFFLFNGLEACLVYAQVLPRLVCRYLHICLIITSLKKSLGKLRPGFPFIQKNGLPI